MVFFIIARLCNSQLSVVYVVVFCCYKVIVVDQGTLWYNIFALFRKVRPIQQTHKVHSPDSQGCLKNDNKHTRGPVCFFLGWSHLDWVVIVVVVVDIVILVKSCGSGCAQTLFSSTSPPVLRVMQAQMLWTLYNIWKCDLKCFSEQRWGISDPLKPTNHFHSL